MKYIIDEKELKDMLNQYILSSADNIEDDVYRLLIDKRPIELIAEGKIDATKTRTEHWQDFEIGEDFGLTAMCELIENLINKDVENIKLYIEVV